MSQNDVILYTLLGYGVVLLAIGVWARGRNRDNTDFFLGGRRLGPWLAALSGSASSSSAWTLLAVSGAAYGWGLSALWLFPATLGGFLINWFLIAPRLRLLSRETGAITVAEIIAPVEFGASRQRVLRVAAVIVLFCFMFYIASQFEGAGKAFQSHFGWSREAAILAGVAIVLAYTLLGGFWAVSVSDLIQGLMMAATAVLVPLAALLAVGGPAGLAAGLLADASPEVLSLTGPFGGAMGLAFVLGTLGIGLGYPGQPHVVNRFMALRDEASLRRARVIAIGWAVIVYAGMLLLGLCARVLYEVGDGEQVLFETSAQVLPPFVAGFVLAAVLSAIMSTADSQLLVAASCVAHDWNAGSPAQNSRLSLSRLTVLLLCVAAAALAIFVAEDIFTRVLFAWHAVGSAFGPLLLMRVLGRPVGVGATLATLVTGAGLTVILHWLPAAPGDAAERLLPLAAAMSIAWFFRGR
ncbi:MAG: sodium/proline symporter [Gammaproteobacteria bacterium]